MWSCACCFCMGLYWFLWFHPNSHKHATRGICNPNIRVNVCLGPLEGNGILFNYSLDINICQGLWLRVLLDFIILLSISGFMYVSFFLLLYWPFYFSKDTSITGYLSDYICGIMGRYSKSILSVCMPLGSLQKSILRSKWF